MQDPPDSSSLSTFEQKPEGPCSPYAGFYLRLSLPEDQRAAMDFPAMAWNMSAECWSHFFREVALRNITRAEQRVLKMVVAFYKAAKSKGLKGPITGHLKAMLYWTKHTVMMDYILSKWLMLMLSKTTIQFSISVYATSSEGP